MDMTRQILKDYRKNIREIRFLEEELHEMNTSDAGLGNSTIFDYNTGYPHPQSVVGFDQDRYKRRARALEKKRQQVKAVKDWIEEIEDGQTRCVFRMRYIDGMNWVKIAEKTGYGGREDYVRRHIRDKYLAKCKIR